MAEGHQLSNMDCEDAEQEDFASDAATTMNSGEQFCPRCGEMLW